MSQKKKERNTSGITENREFTENTNKQEQDTHELFTDAEDDCGECRDAK